MLPDFARLCVVRGRDDLKQARIWTRTALLLFCPRAGASGQRHNLNGRDHALLRNLLLLTSYLHSNEKVERIYSGYHRAPIKRQLVYNNNTTACTNCSCTKTLSPNIGNYIFCSTASSNRASCRSRLAELVRCSPAAHCVARARGDPCQRP
jgi:hypothetical protein